MNENENKESVIEEKEPYNLLIRFKEAKMNHNVIDDFYTNPVDDIFYEACNVFKKFIALIKSYENHVRVSKPSINSIRQLIDKIIKNLEILEELPESVQEICAKSVMIHKPLNLLQRDISQIQYYIPKDDKKFYYHLTEFEKLIYGDNEDKMNHLRELRELVIKSSFSQYDLFCMECILSDCGINESDDLIEKYIMFMDNNDLSLQDIQYMLSYKSYKDKYDIEQSKYKAAQNTSVLYQTLAEKGILEFDKESGKYFFNNEEVNDPNFNPTKMKEVK